MINFDKKSDITIYYNQDKSAQWVIFDRKCLLFLMIFPLQQTQSKNVKQLQINQIFDSKYHICLNGFDESRSAT